MTDVYLEGLDPATRRRFKRVKHRSQERQGLEYLDHDTFLTMVLDVWELHERDQAADATAQPAQPVPADGGAD